MRISDGTDVCSSDLLDRQAREHQAAIERASEDRKHYIERMSLLSSLRGELVAYYDVLSKHIYFHRLQEKVYKKASEAGVICGKMNYALSYDFIAYRESLNKIGYLGASISGDLAKVCRPPPVTMESAEMDADLAFKIHEMVASGLEKHRTDVYHVGKDRKRVV